MITPFARLAVLVALVMPTATAGFIRSATACDIGCPPGAVEYARVAAPVSYDEFNHAPAHSWVFKRSTYTNDPETGVRVAQYARKDPVEPLDDQRLVTSSYRRMRSENRGRNGSMDTTYVVQGWGNGGGGIDAEWQMFNDVWKESILSGSFYNGEQAAGPWGDRWTNGWNNGWNNGGWGGGPGWNNGGWNGGWGTPGWNGGGTWNGGGRRNRDGHWPSDNRAPLRNDFP
jgi:hypothetical protein